MATIDELKKKDGSAVQLGAVRPAPATGAGSTPALDPDGYLPGESVMGRVGRRASEAGAGVISGLRTVAKTMNLGAPGAATGLPFNSNAGAGRGAVPAGTPVGINQPAAALALAAPEATPAATPGAAPILPGATLPGQPPQTVAIPAVAASGTPVAAPTSTSALPSVPSGAIRRIGNSYSGEPNIAGDITVNGGSPTGGVISAQNNLAAENLARRYGQTSGFGPAGAIRGGGTVSSIDTSAGHAQNLKELAAIEAGKAEQNTNMKAQESYAANKVLEERALAKDKEAFALLGKKMDASAGQLTDQTARREQDIQSADRGAIRKLAQDRFGLDANTATLDQKSKQQLMDAQQEYLAAGDDPVKLKAAERKLMTLGGKQQAAVRAFAVPGGQGFNRDGTPYTIASSVYDPDAKQFIQQQGAPAQPAAMPPKDQLVKGQTYPTPRGNAVWDGQQFTPV